MQNRFRHSGLGLGYGQVFSGSVSWTPLKPLGGETPSFWVKENSRSGLTLTDSVNVANSSTILLPYLHRNNTVYSYVNDNGGLDIGATSFTVCGWVNNLMDKTATRFFFGKSVVGSREGRYGFQANITSGYFACHAQSSGGYKNIDSTIDSTTAGWTFLLMDINLATSKIRFFINNTQIGVDTAFTGSFANLANQYRFYIGAANTDGTGAATVVSQADTADIRVYNRLLTPTEQTTLYNYGHVDTAKAHYPCNSWVVLDASGNGYHHTGSGLTSAFIDYGVNGSRHLLDKGYDIYKKMNAVDLYVAYSDAGVALVSPTIPTGYYKSTIGVSAFAGDTLNHNLADSMIVFIGDSWDRSSVTLFSDNARAATTKYIAGTPKAWHPNELDYSVMRFFANDGYKAKCFPKITDTSTYDRKILKELISYATDKTSADLKKVLTYTNDIGGYHEIAYEFETDHICTQRDNKTLYFLSGRYLRLSLDYGSSYVNTIDLNGITNIITFARIYPNGNIVFASHTKVYYSTDNLATYAESTVTGIDGNPFVPTTYTNFRTLNYHEDVTIGGQFVDVWGTYSTEVGTADVNINIWETTDYGVNIKSVWLRNTTDPPLTVRHIHSAAYNPTDDSFWFISGDVLGDCHWIKGVRNMGTGEWTFIHVLDNTPNTPQQALSHWFEGNYVYWASEFHGLFRCLYTDITDITKHEKVTRTESFSSVYDDGNILTCCLGNIDGTSPKKRMMISTDNSKTFYTHEFTGGPDLTATWRAYQGIERKNALGYYKIGIFQDSEDYVNWTAGTVLMVKINTL